jgi:hypothetical protein
MDTDVKSVDMCLRNPDVCCISCHGNFKNSEEDETDRQKQLDDFKRLPSANSTVRINVRKTAHLTVCNHRSKPMGVNQGSIETPTVSNAFKFATVQRLLACVGYLPRFVLLVFIFVELSSYNLCAGQTLRNFPPLFNAAKNQPLTTIPSQSTCGYPTMSAYCKSSTYDNSISECRQDFCIQDCPRRMQLADHVNLLSGSGYGSCVIRDTVNVRPGSDPMGYSASFTAIGPLCYLDPSEDVNVGANGAFTVAFWIWPEDNNFG